MRVVAVPVKSLSRAKSRLAPALSALERGALTLAMLEDVLDAAQGVAGWDAWVVSPDEVALEIAARRGVRAVAEEKPSLANAVRQVERLAKEGEADALAILPGDLPLVTPDALQEALRTLGAVVMARSADGSGTSLLLRRPPRVMPARFGSDSFGRHLQMATERDLPVAIVERRELSFDLDRPGDILALLSDGRRGRTREVCLQMDLGERLRHTA
ncbi:MAG TPA: 2-phospho-L-lactate guanylyltransferase [Actinomycetota bacterium]